MKQANIDQMLAVLEQQSQAGKPWVVYEKYKLPEHPSELSFFDSATAAAAFCEANQWVRDPEDGSYNEGCYHFHTAANLQAEYQYLSGEPPKLLISPDVLWRHLLDNNIHPHNLFDERSAIIKLAYGRTEVMSKPITFIPNQVSSQYHIVQHSHQSAGLIYELGHGTKVLYSNSDYASAVGEFFSLGERLPPDQKGYSINLNFIIQYKDLPLILDMEGHPANNCGLTLGYVNNRNGQVAFELVCDHHRPIITNLQFFTRYDPEQSRLIHLDDRLTEISPGSTLLSVSEHYYHSRIDNKLIDQVLYNSQKYHLRSSHENPGMAGPDGEQRMDTGLKP
ncbi:hypothetical protein HB364_13665 [Pseudoflavitalea sp. X16]|uniref:hypothetical protein n=1 Tax=Paraflavitalea devenefica TaxID=2716334 RepID=UPI00142046C1|nr:hypothetical protein [Paraflavitalea devenefica]NII26136.1 hypothetical protein [Paraflavitalea devenefica]